MALSAVRKSGRIKTRKKSSLLSDDFEYDERKFDLEDNTTTSTSVVEETTFEVDVSGNISNLLHSHSKERSDEDVSVNNVSFPNVMSKLGKGESSRIDDEDDGPSFVDLSNLVCPLCDKHLSSSDDLETHIVEHHAAIDDSQVISCDICGKILSDLNSYKRHIRSHTGDRPFQCDQCEKNFADSASLKRHMKTHEDDRPFSCEICQKSFRDTASISRHMLTHTDRPRMFQCSFCDKNFTDKSGLKRHERTHSGVRPYVCEVCQKTFTDSGSFKRHQKIHIGIRNHHCPQCNRSFMEKQSLVRHQKTVCKLMEDSDTSNSYPDGECTLQGNVSHISNVSNDSQDNSRFFLDDASKDSSSNSNPTANNSDIPTTKQLKTSASDKSLDQEDILSSAEGKPEASLVKNTPSLSSLIQKDPGLYDSISEIVESIDSYEKMLDLCGDRGQTEIDAALKRDAVPMPNSLLCFECGELLVDGVNFKSEGKTFHPSMTNAFKCLNCEEDDDYGEPPVLMPQYEDVGTEGNQIDEPDEVSHKESSESTENFYGSEEPMKHFRERLKTEHGVCFIGDGYENQSDGNEESNKTPCRSSSTDSEQSSKPPVIGELPPVQDEIVTQNGEELDSSLSPVNVMYAHQMEQLANWSSTLPKLEYEADDPNIPSVFPCHLCTKVFASSSFLAQHLDLHKKSPHKCMVCGKTFTSALALKRHMRMHTGEKPYACPNCKKQFRDPSNFSKHKKNCSNVSSASSPLDSHATTNSAQSYISVENQPEKADKKNSKVCSRSKKSLNFVVENFTPVKEEQNESINFHYDAIDSVECNDGKLEEVVNFPVMTVTPSLDDDMIDESHDDKNQEKDGEPGERLESQKEIDYVACEICQKLCENEQHLEMHMNYHTGNPDVTCIECGKSFADPFGMKRHMRIHAGIRPFTCEYCGRGYCDNWSLKKHKSKGCMKVEVQVPTDYLHPCPQCSRVFSDLEFLQEHMKIHKGLMKYECDVCKKRFSEAFNLKKHRRLHMAICPGCGQEFRNIKLMTIHQESECTSSAPAKVETEVSKSFSCDVCGRVYSTKAYLERHRKIHSELKPHVCEICNKRFSEAFKLRRHKKTSHSDLKPFACPDCGKCFSDDAALKRHTVSSSCALSKVIGEPVSSETCACQLCDKVFQKNYMLVRHMTVHSQDRPFSCDVCGRSYKDTSSLKRHQMIHQGVKDFICPICGKDFYYSDSLKRHMGGRCGKKNKTRRRKAAQKKGKKCNSLNDNIASNELFHNNNNNNNSSSNNNNNIEMPTSIESWKNKLHTTAYVPSSITGNAGKSFPCYPANEVRKEGKWTCFSKGHCWLCDVKAPSTSGLISHHRQIHQHRKRFLCPKCFLRFFRKIYWRAHSLTCGSKMNKVPGSTKIRLKRKRNFDMVDPSSVLLEETLTEDGERKRPRRSVPRAQWSWISQI